MTQLQADTFWQYSISVYANDAVKLLCLKLQDNYGFNVNLLLLCGWLQEQHLSLQTPDIKALLKVLHGSELKIRAHRKIRKALPKGSKEWQKSLAMELKMEAEQQRILILEMSKRPLKICGQDNNTNLLCYFQQIPEAGLTSCIELHQLFCNRAQT